MTLINRLSIAVLGLIYSASSLAGGGGSLIYGPVVDPVSSNPIPTLSETMLIVLSLLLVAIVFRVSQKSHSNTLMLVLVGVLGTSAVLSTNGELKLISDVYADGGTGGGVLVPLSSRNGGEATIFNNQLSIFENISGRNQRVIEINLPTNCPNTDAGQIQGVSRCEEGAVVPTTTQGMCYVDCRLLQS